MNPHTLTGDTRVTDPSLAELQLARDHLMHSIAQLDRAIERHRAPRGAAMTETGSLDDIDRSRLETLADEVGMPVAKEAVLTFAAGLADRAAQIERAWIAGDDAVFARRLAELWSASQMFGAASLARWGQSTRGEQPPSAAEFDSLRALATRTAASLERWALLAS